MKLDSFFSCLARYYIMVGGITLQFTIQGCVAYQFTSDVLGYGEDKSRRGALQHLVLAVERSATSTMSYKVEDFVEDLNGAQVFKSVEYLDRMAGADLVLSSFVSRETGPHEACLWGFAGQVVTIATGGILPQICKSEHEVSFRLFSSKKPAQEKTVSFSYQTRSIMGWVAFFYLPWPDWNARPLNEHYPNLLRSVFTREAEGVERLLQ